MRRVILSLAALAFVGACGSAASNKTAAPTVVTTAAPTTTAAPATTVAPTTTAAPATTVAPQAGTTTTAAKKVTTLEEAKATFAEQNGVSAEQAGCVVDALAASVGQDATLAMANTDDDITTLSATQQDAAVAAFDKCVPKDVFTKAFGDELVSAAKDAGAVVTAEQATCAASKIVSGLTMHDLLVDLAGNDFTNLSLDKQALVGGALQACLPADALAKLGN